MKPGSTITDIKQSLEVFNSSLADLERAYGKISEKIEHYEKNEIVPRCYLSEMAGNLAHEIRNPLSVISSLVELLSQEKGIADTRNIQGILSGVERIDRVVENLIIYSRPLTPKPIDCNFCGLLGQALEALKIELAEQAEMYEINSGIPAEDVYTKIDPALMLQAIQNILHNAKEAMTDGGKIEMRLEIDNQKKNLVLTIADEGHGLSDSDPEKPFYPFFTTKTYGMGLGLPTARLIVEKHGGTVQLTNGLRQGVEVTVVLPIL